jgi:hypothetical protein
MEIHEWGTFTSLVGSNGITQNGMYHEDEALPDFVHHFGEVINGPAPLAENRSIFHNCKVCIAPQLLAANGVTQKMETPVVYFYSDKAQHIEMNVRFPQGVITETYPGPVRTFPSKLTTIAGGDTTFSLNVASPKAKRELPVVDEANIYSHARNVNSNLVYGGNGEVEQFVFYRGLGRFQPKLQISSLDGALTLDTVNHGKRLSAFLVHVNEAGEAQAIRILSESDQPFQISNALIANLADHEPSRTKPSVITAPYIHARFVTALASEGLNADEAQAMINTWEHGYLHVPGLRLLYVIPRTEVDQVLPLSFTPAPERLVRVFVGRIEILTDTQEKGILENILAQKEGFPVQSLGRFAESILRRVAELAPKENAALFAGLIAKAQVSGEDASTSVR